MTRLFRHLRLDRPLCFVDCEATGTSPARDRLIEVAAVRFAPDAAPARFARRVDPGVPIPPAAAAVHRITDGDVSGCPPFAAVAPDLARFLGAADLGGFNVVRYDAPLLAAEFARAGVPFDLAGRRFVDVMPIYHARHPRTLAAAAECYLGAAHPDAHGAAADVRASAAVLDAMLAAHPDLPRTVDGLHRLVAPADIGGRLRPAADGRLHLAFGKYAGRPLDEVAAADGDYLCWLVGQDFLPDFKALVRDALARAGRCRA